MEEVLEIGSELTFSSDSQSERNVIPTAMP